MNRCVECGTTESIDKSKGWQHWRYRNGKTYCKKCHCRLFDNPKYRAKWNPINNPKYCVRRIAFKDKRIMLKKNPRKGTCKKCGKGIGDEYIDKRGKTRIIKSTHMHHRIYDAEHPLRHTRELCPSCHLKTRKPTSVR